MARACLLLLAAVVVKAQLPSPIQDCGSSATITSLTITPNPCDKLYTDEHGAVSCTIDLHQSYTGYINFTATTRHEKAYGHASAELGILEAGDFTIKREACEGDVVCPILPDVPSYYTSTISVIDAPSARGSATWRITDENDLDIFCFVFPVFVDGN